MPGSNATLRVVLTKFEAPAVTLGYEITIEAP